MQAIKILSDEAHLESPRHTQIFRTVTHERKHLHKHFHHKLKCQLSKQSEGRLDPVSMLPKRFRKMEVMHVYERIRELLGPAGHNTPVEFAIWESLKQKAQLLNLQKIIVKTRI